MKYAIKVLQSHYKLLIPLVSANADNKEEYSKLRGQQSEILEALSILNGEMRESVKDGVSDRALWRIEPYFDGISTAVTTYKVVDQNGTLQYMGDRSQCEYFLQHGC